MQAKAHCVPRIKQPGREGSLCFCSFPQTRRGKLRPREARAAELRGFGEAWAGYMTKISLDLSFPVSSMEMHLYMSEHTVFAFLVTCVPGVTLN